MSDTPKRKPEDFLDKLPDPEGTVSSPKSDGGTDSSPAPKSPEPEEKPAAPENEGSRGKDAPVFSYLAILFAAAFFMLLMAYLMQQRNNEMAMSGLRNSLSQFQSLDELLDENQELREEVSGLEDQLAELQEEYDSLEKQYINISNMEQQESYELTLSRSLTTAEYFYEAGDYLAAAQRLVSITEDELNAISTESDSGAPSDAERYETLKAALLELGYIQEDENGYIQLADNE